MPSGRCPADRRRRRDGRPVPIRPSGPWQRIPKRSSDRGHTVTSDESVPISEVCHAGSQMSSSGPALGCIADDVTGATDLASTLTREGLRVQLMVGTPRDSRVEDGIDAIIVALKTRTAAADEAVASSVTAARWLTSVGATLVYFKYCSTFDSRPDGNIGPVADALLDELSAGHTIVCPAYPETGRTVYRGRLFVGDLPLDESSMASHPLTPMRDSSLVRLLQAQTARRIAMIPYPVVRDGPASIRAAVMAAVHDGATYLVIDALDDHHLRDIGDAVGDYPLVTGASGVARGLPAALRRRGLLGPPRPSRPVAVPDGPSAVLAGSLSIMTQQQLDRFRGRADFVLIDPDQLADDPRAIDELVRGAVRSVGSRPVVVRAMNDPAKVRRAQDRLGIDASGAIVEAALGEIAAALLAAGVRRFVVAGGETAAAVVTRLGIRSMRVGADIAPGVPWCLSAGEPGVGLALKSGNFGGVDFLVDALGVLE